MDIPLNIFPNPIFTNEQVQAPVKELKEFNPYVFNAGTVIGIGGPGFCVVAGDTRLSQRYSIVSRNSSKIKQLADKTFLATSGMYADFVALSKNLETRLQMYEFNMGRQASTESIAQFFPYYTFNVLAGLSAKNQGIVYGYDAIGSFDVRPYIVQGSGQELICPVLDNMLEGYNKKNPDYPNTIEEVADLIVDCFNSAAERDIYTGDQIEMVLLQPGSVIRKYYPLRKD